MLKVAPSLERKSVERYERLFGPIISGLFFWISSDDRRQLGPH